MKLRQKSKRDQALDAIASVAKTWSEWRLGDKVSQTASKASKKASKTASKASKKASKTAAKASKKAKKASLPGAAKRKPVRVAGAIALLGGIGAAVAKKLSGGKAEPLYTPPGPAPDMTPPPPSPVAVEDLTQDPPAEMPPVPPTVEPALTASTEVPEPEPSPVVVEDLTSEAPAAEEAQDTSAEPAFEPPGSDVPEAAPVAEDSPPSVDLTDDDDTDTDTDTDEIRRR